MVETGEETSTGFWQIGMKRVNNNVRTLLYRREKWEVNSNYDFYFVSNNS